jgi:hypothetical protein
MTVKGLVFGCLYGAFVALYLILSAQELTDWEILVVLGLLQIIVTQR